MKPIFTMTQLSGPIFNPNNLKNPSKVVLFLHGYGANGDDLISLAPLFAPHIKDAIFISPNAPFPCDMNPLGYQWFPITDYDYNAWFEGVKKAESILNTFIDETLQTYCISEKDLFLIGFSQGTMVSLHTALRRKKPVGGISGI